MLSSIIYWELPQFPTLHLSGLLLPFHLPNSPFFLTSRILIYYYFFFLFYHCLQVVETIFIGFHLNFFFGCVSFPELCSIKLSEISHHSFGSYSSSTSILDFLLLSIALSSNVNWDRRPFIFLIISAVIVEICLHNVFDLILYRFSCSNYRLALLHFLYSM